MSSYSPGPGDYLPDTACVWQIEAACGDIVLKFDEMDIEPEFDSIKVYQCEPPTGFDSPFTKCATEDMVGNMSVCVCPGTRRHPGTVRYGDGNSWVERSTETSVKCDYETFHVGAAPGKWCECKPGGRCCTGPRWPSMPYVGH